jgi:phosphatidylinositol-3-phosphatase
MCRHWIAAALAATVLSLSVQAAPAAGNKLPRLDHVVVVILENHSPNEVIGQSQAPFIHSLAMGGAMFVKAYAVAHPSLPNYFALFSGSTQGVSDDGDYTFDAPNLASALQAAHKSFIGYAETGSPRRHNPWESFVNASATGRDLKEFPSDFRRLPTVSFVVPDLQNDMHDGSVRRGDNWLKVHLGPYAQWAKSHNSLLIVLFDEDDDSDENRVPVIFYGAHVRPGQYAERISHYNVLSTILAIYGLPPFGEAAINPPIRTIWKSIAVTAH